MNWVLSYKYKDAFSLAKDGKNALVSAVNGDGYAEVKVYFDVSGQPV